MEELMFQEEFSHPTTGHFVWTMQVSYDEHGNREIKIAVLGLHGSGKTSMVRRFVKNDYNPSEFPTQRVNNENKIIKVNNESLCISFWDIAGQQGYNSIASLYFRMAHVIAFVYDITNPKSYSVAQDWVNKVALENCCVYYLVGNKCDKEEDRAITFAEAKKFADEHDALFIECSAKEDVQVSEFIETACRAVLEAPTRNASVRLSRPRPENESSDCC